MRAGVERLSEREREVLRLLSRGHDAKSIASNLKLSVHTVNERLRNARRKLGASSSREAARVLFAHEVDTNFSGDDRSKEIGVAIGKGSEAYLPGIVTNGARDKQRVILVGIGGVMLVALLSVFMTLGISADPSPAISANGRPAHEMMPIPSLFTETDYPADALAGGVAGDTQFKLQITAGGRIENCQIERSSGSAALDAATCSVIRRRARFYPAIDATGRAVASAYSGTIQWTTR